MTPAIKAIKKAQQARNDGDFVTARKHYTEAAEIYRDLNDLLTYAHTIRHLADIFRKEANLAEAQRLYEESLQIYRGSLDTKLLDLANTVRPYALLHEEQRDLGRARELWEEARNLYASLQIEAGVYECEAHLVQLQKV